MFSKTVLALLLVLIIIIMILIAITWQKRHERSKQATAHFQSGYEKLKGGRWQAAELEFSKAIFLDSKLVDAYFYRGITYVGRERYDEAKVDLNRCLQLNPRHGSAYIERAYLTYKKQQYELSLADLNQGIQLQPYHFLGYYRRAIVYRELGNFEQALDDIQRSLELIPNQIMDIYAERGVIRHLRGEFQNALEDFDKAIKLLPKSPIPYAVRANTMLAQKNWTAAIDDITRAIEYQAPDLYPLYVNRAKAYLELRDLDRALSDCKRALAINMDSPFAFCIRGNVQLLQEKWGSAIEDYTSAIQRNHPETPLIYADRASAYYKLGNFEAALSDSQRAIELRPSSPVAHAVIGNVRVNQQDWQGAIEAYTHTIETQFPRLDWAYFSRSIAYSRAGNLNAAIDDVTNLLQIKPDNAAAYNNRGYWSALLGNLDQALSDCNEAIRLNPNPVYGYGSRGYTYFLMGRYAEALADFQKSAELKPDHPFAIAGQAICHSAVGNADEATRLWKSLIELDPRYKDAETLRTEYQAGEAFVSEARKITAKL